MNGSAHDQAPKGPARYDIVCYLVEEWDRLPRRPHLEALGRIARVLLIEKPMNAYSPVQKPRKFLRWLLHRDRITQLGANLYLARPAMAVPYGLGFRYPWLARINRWLVKGGVSRAVRRLGMQPDAAFIFSPAQNFLRDVAGEHVLCYEIIDQYADYPGLSSSGAEHSLYFPHHVVNPNLLDTSIALMNTYASAPLAID